MQSPDTDVHVRDMSMNLETIPPASLLDPFGQARRSFLQGHEIQ
jgi:hypothetical protein